MMRHTRRLVLFFLAYLALTLEAPLWADELTPSEWSVYNKGNKHVVFRYLGADAVFRGKILRLRMLPGHEQIGTAADELNGATEQSFQANFMAPSLGEKFLVASRMLAISPQTLAGFNRRLFSRQGAHLRGRRSLDESIGYGMLQDDVNSLQDHALVVELKPKYGLLPSSPFVTGLGQIKKGVSHFQLLQKLKVKEGAASSISSYDPLQLFSGESLPIKNALNSLFATPQNNLRVFSEGHLIDASEFRQLTWLPEVLHAILERSPILAAVKRLQALDTVGVEGAYGIYQIDKDKLKTLAPEEFWNPSSMLRPLAVALNDPLAVNPSFGAEEAGEWLAAAGFEVRMQLLQQYLLAAVAKDCSILISIAPLSSGVSTDEVSIVTVSAQSFSYIIKVVDTEPKALSKIPVNFVREQAMLRLWGHGGHGAPDRRNL